MTKHWDLKKRNGFNILSDWTTEKMRRFYPFCRVAHQNEPPEIDTTKDHCGTKAESMMIGATTIWFYSNYVASNNIRWMENSKDSNEASNHKRWLELNRDWYIHYMWWQDVKGQRMSFDLLQPLIEFRIIWRQQPIIWRKLWFLTLKDSMAYGGSLANFPIFPEPNLGISWEFHDIAGKKPDDYQERIGNSSRRLGFSPTRIGLEKSSNSSKKMKMLTNKTVVWTRRMGSPWITWGIETQRRDIKQQWNSQQWDGDWTTIKDVICWLAHTVQHRVPCTSRWLDLRENIQEVRCSTMRIYRNLAKNNLFNMNWRDRRLQAQISIAGPQLNLGTIEGAITSATAHVRMKKRNSSHRYFLENCGLTRQDWCIEPV